MGRLVGPLLEDYIVRHSMRAKWLLLHSQTIQFLPNSPSLVSPGGARCRFRFSVASHSLYRSKLSHPRLSGTD